jgi:hypothetical protein
MHSPFPDVPAPPQALGGYGNRRKADLSRVRRFAVSTRRSDILSRSSDLGDAFSLHLESGFASVVSEWRSACRARRFADRQRQRADHQLTRRDQHSVGTSIGRLRWRRTLVESGVRPRSRNRICGEASPPIASSVPPARSPRPGTQSRSYGADSGCSTPCAGPPDGGCAGAATKRRLSVRDLSRHIAERLGIDESSARRRSGVKSAGYSPPGFMRAGHDQGRMARTGIGQGAVERINTRSMHARSAKVA